MLDNQIQSSLTDPSLLTDKAYINGQWCSAQNDATIDVINPSNGKVIATVPNLTVSQIEQTIENANTAWKSWKTAPAIKHAEKLSCWYQLMMDNQDDLARIMTLEQGKPFQESKGEITYAASFIKWFAEEARRINGETHPDPTEDRRLMTIKQPVGVCAAITPWNFPAAMITRKCAPAIAAGCTILVKPADLTPLSALALAVLAERVGSLLMAQSAPTVKRLSLELGGNAPFIVFEDADIDEAVKGLMISKFRNAGQTCVCANRVLVHDKIYDQFTSALVAATAKLKLGDGFAEGVAIGLLINENAVAKVKAHIEDSLQKGASIAYGEIPSGESLFVKPTILKDVTVDMLPAVDETFGPLAPLIRFHTDEEALEIANGLGAYYYTQNMKRAWNVGEALEFGMIGLNTGVISMDSSPFGGVKSSGVGREGSNLGIEEYLEVKAWHIGGL